jgi:hypothetical protein
VNLYSCARIQICLPYLQVAQSHLLANHDTVQERGNPTRTRHLNSCCSDLTNRHRNAADNKSFHIADDGILADRCFMNNCSKASIMAFLHSQLLVRSKCRKILASTKVLKMKVMSSRRRCDNWRSANGTDIFQYIGYVGYQTKICICHSCSSFALYFQWSPSKLYRTTAVKWRRLFWGTLLLQNYVEFCSKNWRLHRSQCDLCSRQVSEQNSP